MWCTVCKFAFDWATGHEIRDRSFHNPHAIEYQARTGYQPRAAGDEICGGLPNPWRRDRARDVWTTEAGKKVSAIYRHARETEDMFIRPFRTSHLDDDLEKLRVKYILGQLDEKAWRTGILRVHRKREIQVHRLQLYELGYTVVVEKMNEFIHLDHKDTEENCLKLIDTVKEVVDFINEQITELLAGYGVAYKNYFLTPTFRVVSNAKRYAKT